MYNVISIHYHLINTVHSVVSGLILCAFYIRTRALQLSLMYVTLLHVAPCVRHKVVIMCRIQPGYWQHILYSALTECMICIKVPNAAIKHGHDSSVGTATRPWAKATCQ